MHRSLFAIATLALSLGVATAASAGPANTRGSYAHGRSVKAQTYALTGVQARSDVRFESRYVGPRYERRLVAVRAD